MTICRIYILSIMITTYATKQHKNKIRMIQYEIESTFVQYNKQHEYLHRVVYESNIKCLDKLCID